MTEERRNVMKKTISLVLALTLTLLLCACGGNNDAPASIEAASPAEPEIATEPVASVTETTVAATEESIVTSASFWQIDYLVDDFGDPTDKACMKTAVLGEFSNTATMGDDLTAVVFFCPACSNENYTSYFSFKLIEYNDHPATYLPGDKIIMKVKIGDTVTEEKLMGTAPNGDLYLVNGKMNGQVIDSDLYDAIYKALVLGEESVRCIIEIGSSKYNFTLNGVGFADTANEMMGIYGFSSYDVRNFV